MLKKSLSSLELAALIHELQFLVGSRIIQVYQPEKKEILLQLNVPRQEKVLLRIISGQFLLPTQRKEMPVQPSSFCLQLRKYLNNATIRELRQQDSERIVVFTVEKEELYFLIVELFARGNILLTDKKMTIIGTLEQQHQKERTIKVKEKYVFPTIGVNWKELTEKKVAELLQQSQKKNVVVSLATELGVGGVYAEELCRRANLGKDTSPKDVKKADAAGLFAAFEEVKKALDHPKGYVYDGEIAPFPLPGKELRKETATYREALTALEESLKKPSPYEQKIASLKKLIAHQETAVAGLQEKIAVNTKKGERLYEEYGQVSEILQRAKEVQHKDGWEAVKAAMQKEKNVVSVDLKTKKIVVDL